MKRSFTSFRMTERRPGGSSGYHAPGKIGIHLTRHSKTVRISGIVVHTYMNRYFTYMTSNKKRGSIYTGMTNNLIRRVTQHKQRKTRSFTRRYNLDKLVWYESFPTAIEAIRREKEIKGWVRSKKIALIESMNPEWEDLYEDLIKTFDRRYGRMSDSGESENRKNKK